MERKRTGMGRISGNSFSRVEGKAGENKGVSGGPLFRAGTAVIYSGLCGLRAGALSYGAVKNNRRIKMERKNVEWMLLQVCCPIGLAHRVIFYRKKE